MSKGNNHKQIAERPATIGARLFALLQSILEDGTAIPAMYHPIVESLVKNYLKKADDSQLREVIVKLRDELIPWILDEHKNPE